MPIKPCRSPRAVLLCVCVSSVGTSLQHLSTSAQHRDHLALQKPFVLALEKKQMYVLAALTFTAEGNACSGRLSGVGKGMLLHVSGTMFAYPCVCTTICSSFKQRKELLLPSHS